MTGDAPISEMRAGRVLTRRSHRHRVAALTLAIGALLVVSMQKSVAQAPLPDPLAAGWKGNAVCAVLQEDARMRALRCTFPPGGGHEKHFHAPHFGYVLEGGLMRITDKTGERVQQIKTGASWRSDGVEWHEAVNIGETTSVYLIIEPKAAH